jgi:hypothetical protein
VRPAERLALEQALGECRHPRQRSRADHVPQSHDGQLIRGAPGQVLEPRFGLTLQVHVQIVAASGHGHRPWPLAQRDAEHRNRARMDHVRAAGRRREPVDELHEPAILGPGAVRGDRLDVREVHDHLRLGPHLPDRGIARHDPGPRRLLAQ